MSLVTNVTGSAQIASFSITFPVGLPDSAKKAPFDVRSYLDLHTTTLSGV